MEIPPPIEIIQKYTNFEKIGEGTYGNVYKATNKFDKKHYALKKFKLEYEDEGIPSTAIREISLIKRMNLNLILRIKPSEYSQNRRNRG